ncbi:Ubiquitin system component Cue protein [Euphorbia peplus]|nr:Ubiquitin system component Cue protein [Euphorbia peplus]
MSAVVCGSKRSFFHEDLPSPPVSKRLCCGSSSPSRARFSPPSSLHQLQALFPLVDPQLLERAVEECGNNLDAAIKSLNEHCSESAEHNSGSAEAAGSNADQGTLPDDGVATAKESAPENLPGNGAEWVDLFVREMMSASSVDDARARAARVLEILEKSISSQAAKGVVESFQKETMMLKEHIEVLVRENTILKRAVAIQHERQKEFDDKNKELQQLKQLVSQYHEQLKSLEMKNYALVMHLRQVEQGSSMPGRFHPDVF